MRLSDERHAPLRKPYTKKQITSELIECATRNPADREYDWDLEMCWALVDALRIGVKWFDIVIEGKKHRCNVKEWWSVFRVISEESTSQTKPDSERGNCSSIVVERRMQRNGQ